MIIRVRNLEGIVQRLRAKGVNLNKATRQAMDASCFELVRFAKKEAPVRTGTLRRSIYGGTVGIEMNRIKGEVVASAPYARAVEFGHWQHERFVPGYWRGGVFVYRPYAGTPTRGMKLKTTFVKANPFMRRSFNRGRKLIPRIFESYLKREL